LRLRHSDLLKISHRAPVEKMRWGKHRGKQLGPLNSSAAVYAANTVRAVRVR